MKKIIMIFMTGLLLISVSVFAQGDVLIFNGNLEVGAADLDGSLEVESADNRHGIMGITGGTGNAVYGTNTDSGGFAGYFDGKVHITSDLTIGGTYSHSHDGSDILGGIMQNDLEVSGNFSAFEYISTSENYKINNVTVLAVSGKNTLIGESTGSSLAVGGLRNTFLGYQAGNLNTLGDDNTFIGNNAGQSNSTGVESTYVGSEAGQSNLWGQNNTFIGFKAGYNNQYGSGNVFIGSETGGSTSVDDELYIDNSNTANPLIHGDFDTNIVTINTILKLSPSATPPQTCSGNAGALYHDSTTPSLCWCNGSSWVSIAGGGTCN